MENEDIHRIVNMHMGKDKVECAIARIVPILEEDVLLQQNVKPILISDMKLVDEIRSQMEEHWVFL